jgi:hypothetical protein
VNADLSVAPEIAQLAQRGPAGPAGPAGLAAGAGTLGHLASELAALAADPRKWWGQVRFDPDAPLTIPLGDSAAGKGVWLLVTPPQATVVCDCDLATLLAGEAAEDGAPLRHGRVRVHGRGQSHVVTGTAGGYAVSLHLAVRAKG